MRIRVFLALALSALVTSACGGDGITGPGSKETITLDFCAAEVPVWFAIQNETEQWQEVPVNAAGTVTFDDVGLFSR
jgi:hypothetical protein